MTSGQHVSLKISEFLSMTKEMFTGKLRDQTKQGSTWDDEFDHLQSVFKNLNMDGRVIFEYGIPSLNFVIDVVVLIEDNIFVLEYKAGDSSNSYTLEDIKQCRNYALRLKYFHNKSNDKWIIPILIEMEAPNVSFEDGRDTEIQVWNTIKCNRDNLKEAIEKVIKNVKATSCDTNWQDEWEKGIYKATPTIIKAACEMWERNNVRGLDSGEADKDTRLAAEDFVMKIVQESKEKSKKSIVFVTGVPGAGKTLVGLGLSVRCQNYGASMLSGNDPLVRVLSTALRRDLDEQYKEGNLKDDVKEKYEFAKKQKTSKERDKEKDSISVDAVIRNAYAYKREIIAERLNWEDNTYTLRDDAQKGTQHVIIFDEAQRAWTKEKMLVPGQSGKKPWQYKSDWPFSEPGLLLWDMNQMEWGVFVCLVGGGQEINTGEAGIGEWMSAITNNSDYKDWQVFVSDQLSAPEYQRKTSEGQSLNDYLEILSKNNRLSTDPDCKYLHLTEGQRSIRTNKVSNFVNELLECKSEEAQNLYYKEIRNTYKIYLTRDIETARKKVKQMKFSGAYPDETRMGMLMSSEAARMRPLGYEIKKVAEYLSKTPSWFLDSPENVNSSDYLEIALNEFFVQGLEVDYSVVMWDADFRYNEEHNDWDYFCFDGKTKWSKKDKQKQDIKCFYMKNAYRVLLTRARLGMIIFIPEGDQSDVTRKPDFYNSTYNYLKGLGIEEI